VPEGADTRARRSVVLVGLMGSGKTTVGRKVARRLGRTFVDADDELQASTGRTVADWFERDGERGFREAEAQVLRTLLDEQPGVVIGAGGGVVVEPANRVRLRADDVTVVYLHADPRFLVSRAKAKPHRPLLTDDPGEVLGRMYSERDTWYREVADTVVEVRPAHEAGEKPKWRLAARVVESLIELGVVAHDEVSPAPVGSDVG